MSALLGIGLLALVIAAVVIAAMWLLSIASDLPEDIDDDFAPHTTRWED